MDRQYIDDNHIVARYLADQLAEPEREAFEAYYLEHPEMLQEIEAAARFKAGLAQLQDSGELAALLSPTPWYARWRYLAVAAVAILGIGVAFFTQAPTPPVMVANLSSLGGPTTIASSHSVLRRRGSPFDAEVTLPRAGAAIELRVLPEFTAAHSRYRISLARLDSDDVKNQLAQVDDVPAADDGMVPIYLDASRIEPGDYEVAISSDEPVEARTSRFLIRILPASNDIG